MTNLQPFFHSVDEVNMALLEIGKLKAQIEQSQAAAEKEINAIKGDTAKNHLPFATRIQALENAIALYVEQKRESLFEKGKKSLPLNFGVVGFRESSSIAIKKVQDTLAKIKSLFPRRKDAIIVKESPDKNVLKKWEDADLKKIGVKREIKDEFYYELNQAEIIASSAQ